MHLFDDLKCQNIDHRLRYIDEICLHKNCTQPRPLCRYCKTSHQQHDDKIVPLDDLEELIKRGKPLEEIQEIHEIKKLVGVQIKDAKMILDNIQLFILKQFEQFDNPIQIINNQEPINIEGLNSICSQLVPIVNVQNKKVQFQQNEEQIYRLKDAYSKELYKLLENIKQIYQNIRIMEETQTQPQFNFKKIDIQNIEYKGNIVRLKKNLMYAQMILIEPQLEQVKVNNIAQVRFKILQNDKFCSFGVSTSDQQNMMSSTRSIGQPQISLTNLLTQSQIFAGTSKVQHMIKSDGEILSTNKDYNQKDIGFKLEKNDIVTIRLYYEENSIEFQKNHGISTKLQNIQIVDNLFGAVALKEIGDSVEIL